MHRAEDKTLIASLAFIMLYSAQSAFSRQAHSRLSIKVCWVKVFYPHNHSS